MPVLIIPAFNYCCQLSLYIDCNYPLKKQENHLFFYYAIDFPIGLMTITIHTWELLQLAHMGTIAIDTYCLTGCQL